jgi:hypothetical protein
MSVSSRQQRGVTPVVPFKNKIQLEKYDKNKENLIQYILNLHNQKIEKISLKTCMLFP